MKFKINKRFSGDYIECKIDKRFENQLDSIQLGAAIKVAMEIGADLRGADLRGAYLRGADLKGADLEPIKNDMFLVLLQAVPEIPMVEKAIIEGKIDGSTYKGKCACLCGTIEKSPRFNEACDMRDENRPIERFFAAISEGDTPGNNHFSKLAYGWIQEFKGFTGITIEQRDTATAV